MKGSEPTIPKGSILNIRMDKPVSVRTRIGRHLLRARVRTLIIIVSRTKIIICRHEYDAPVMCVRA
jgi:hypothetical protein